MAQVADKTGLTRALSAGLGEPGLLVGSHDRGCVIRDLAVMLADGGDCLADLCALGDQQTLFGQVASSSTAFRVIDRIASDPDGLERLRSAHACARARAWKLGGAPAELDIDLDATLLTSHSEKEGAAGNFKGGFGFHPMLAYGGQTGEALAGELRAGNAGANTAADQIDVAEQAIAQIPVEHIEGIDLLLRVDSAGASHELLDWCRDGRIRYSVGYDLTETVREAIVQIPDGAWVSAVDQDGSQRPNGNVAEITGALDLTGWPAGSRVIVRRERAHPGAQLSFTDHDGHRFQAILTDQAGENIAAIERRHRARARVEDHIRNDKHTGLQNMPFRDFEHNRVWLALVLIAHNLIAWTQRLLLTGELARCEPKRLRYRYAARRRAPRLSRPHRHPAPAALLALGPRARRRVSAPQSAPRATRLTCRSATHDDHHRSRRPRAHPATSTAAPTAAPIATRDAQRALN